MSKAGVPAGRWRSRPLDPKCKTFVDADPSIDAQIRSRIPAWSGDFDELVPQLVGHGVRVDDLPKLTAKQVGLFLISAAQGGLLRSGAVGTAAHTIVAAPPLTPVDEGDSWHARTARRLESTPRAVLWFLRENNARSAVDKVTRAFIADALRQNIDVVATAGEVLKAGDKPLIESVSGAKGGWYLLPDGDLVASHCGPPAALATPAPRLRKVP